MRYTWQAVLKPSAHFTVQCKSLIQQLLEVKVRSGTYHLVGLKKNNHLEAAALVLCELCDSAWENQSENLLCF